MFETSNQYIYIDIVASWLHGLLPQLIWHHRHLSRAATSRLLSGMGGKAHVLQVHVPQVTDFATEMRTKPRTVKRLMQKCLDILI